MLQSTTKARSRLSVQIAMVPALLLATSCSGTMPDDSRSSPSGSLVGAWRSRIQFSSGAFAAMKDLEFSYVFNTGGTLTESSNYDGAPPVPPAYGVWREVGPKQFEARYVFYITRPPTRFEDLAGGGGWLPTGHGIFLERILVADDGQSFESTITYEAFDATGKPAEGGGQATGRGVRFGF